MHKRNCCRTYVHDLSDTTDNMGYICYRFRQYVNSEMPKEKSSRPSPPVPFPTLQFAEKGDLWNVMTKKESGMYLRDPQILAGEKHSNLQPRMRAILVDWLIEVSEVSRI